MRTIGAVTVGRSDYGIYRPVLQRIRADGSLRLVLFVGGAHLSPELGFTVREIEGDGFTDLERVEHAAEDDAPLAAAQSMGRATIGFAAAFSRRRPDIVLVLGDRFEMHAAASAAVPLRIPLAHIHGGESSEGAFDEALRHSITKLSHLHFAATEAYARRIVRMGEEPWRVHVTGAPALDQLRDFQPLADEELAARFGVDLSRATLLVTFHPPTLEPDGARVCELLAAVADSGFAAVATYPNADPGYRDVLEPLRERADADPAFRLVPNLGTRAYFTLLGRCAAMVGNSSSGIVEAPWFALPVVNVGSRQDGRLRAANVIDCPPERDAILAAIRRATSESFRERLRGLENPYGDGRAAERIVEALKETPLEGLLVKRFHDGESHAP